MIVFPISVFSQTPEKFERLDSILNVNRILEEEFGKEMMSEMEKMSFEGNPYSYGLSGFAPVTEEHKIPKWHKVFSMCRCDIRGNKLEIAIAFGLMSGIATVIEIDLADSTYQAHLHYSTDGVKSHKLKIEDQFIENLVVPLRNTELEISSDSFFEHQKSVKGRLIGTTEKHYQTAGRTQNGYKEIEAKVLSIFECNVVDFDSSNK